MTTDSNSPREQAEPQIRPVHKLIFFLIAVLAFGTFVFAILQLWGAKR